MKLKKLLSVVVSALLCVSLVGCSTASDSKDDKTIKIGATLVPGGELLEELKPLIEVKGYELVIVTFNYYILPNESLNNGEKINISYLEWWRDWPYETRQPVYFYIHGAKSCSRFTER